MKLAILLLCHKNPEQINMFLETLQYPDIEFFIHVDAKADFADKLISRPDIHVLPESLRVDIGWATPSMIIATMNLFTYAYKKGKYDYYWLCSGQDFPIKTTVQILTYLRQHSGRNFINFLKSKNTNGGYENNYDKRNIIYYPHWLYGRSFPIRLIKRMYVCLTGGVQPHLSYLPQTG